MWIRILRSRKRVPLSVSGGNPGLWSFPVAMILLSIALAVVTAGCGPISSLSPTQAPSPTPASDPTKAPDPTETSSPTPVPEPTETSSPTQTPGPTQKGDQAMAFELTSTAFGPGEEIPGTYTCDGADISPPLQWGDPPQGTQSLVLISDDPDAPMGTWVHWVLFNISADTRELPEGLPKDAELPDGSRHGQNSWKRSDYGGPCPPSGTHRYFFKLYALDTTLELSAGASKKQVLQAMEGHVLAEAELMGVYSR